MLTKGIVSKGKDDHYVVTQVGRPLPYYLKDEKVIYDSGLDFAEIYFNTENVEINKGLCFITEYSINYKEVPVYFKNEKNKISLDFWGYALIILGAFATFMLFLFYYIPK